MLIKDTVTISSTRKRYGRQAMVFAIIIGLFFLILGRKDICRGIVLGTIFSVFNFVLISQSLFVRINKSKPKATLSTIASIMIRYSCMCLPLFVAIKTDKINLLGTVVGLLAVQLIILSTQLTKILLPPKH